MKAYDYIVVRAGSAGCVLANRLSADPSVSVCVIEAGDRAHGLLPDMPIAMLPTCFRDDLNWGLESEPAPYLNGRRLKILRGKALGGSSQINGMAYVRGDARDFDDWRDLGCTGWGYDDVRPYFERAERNWRDDGDSPCPSTCRGRRRWRSRSIVTRWPTPGLPRVTISSIGSRTAPSPPS